MDIEKEYFEGFPAPWGKVLSFLTRAFAWAFFFGLIYLFRSFSLLVFLTFVFSYIQAHGVHILERWITRRSYAVSLVALLFLGVLVAIGSFLIPQVISQAELFADNFRDYIKKVDTQIIALSETFPSLQTIIPEVKQGTPLTGVSGETTQGYSDLSSSLTVTVAGQLFGFEGIQGDVLDVKQLTGLLKNIGKPLLAASSSFFLGLLFSFLIVLDLPRLTRSVKSLQYTKVGFVYDEVADSIMSFGRTLGHALEAQLFIAIVNTALTAIAIYAFGIAGKLAFLSLIVFLCSFIPVAGVFISSVPICLIVLEQMGVEGLVLMSLVIWGIHLLEAYVLNPKIFGNRLHINPVLVLIILTIGGKLFGIWGLLLGVPVCTYVFTDAIRFKDPEVIEEV
jgi:predicted PurR-regulated permease PerM